MDRFERELQRIEREADAENAHQDAGWNTAGTVLRLLALCALGALVIGVKIAFIVAVLRAIGWIS